MTALAGWENFYVVVGSSAGALIGLQFVVITLLAGMPIIKDVERASSAFVTPTIVHFAVALLVSAAISAPWHTITGAAIVWGALGLFGVVYVAVVARRVRSQAAYSPQFEDLLFHLVLPFVAYAMLVGSAVVGSSGGDHALFAVAAAALMLLTLGIHNAWDAVTYQVYMHTRKQQQGEQRQ